MAQYKMIENVEKVTCSEHKRRMKAVNISPNLYKEQIILCEFCAMSQYSNNNIIGLEEIKLKIENKLQNNREELYININTIINKIVELKSKYESTKQSILQNFDAIQSSLDNWQAQTQNMQKKLFEYSFFEEVQQIANKKQNEFNKKNFIDQIKSNNIAFQEKISNKLQELPNFQEIHKILDEILKQDYSEGRNQQTKKIQIQESKITINKIGNLIEQKEQCKSVVFNKQGSIMVSTVDNQIKIWEFQRGVLKLVQILQGHEKSVQTLYISNLNNYLISCSDQIIKLWILVDKWKCQETISMSKVCMTCIVTDSKEKLIIFGSTDNSIQVWQFNLQYNLSKSYQLMGHSRQVNSLSLNQSETLLVSCADSAQDRNQIIVWERTQNQENPFKFKYFVRQNLDINGPEIKFINNEQFVLISSDNNKVLLFEDCKGELVQNFEKDVELSTIGTSERLFPILYNIQKKLLYFKIKSCIYILNSNLQLQSFLQSNGINIQGSVTNDGKYLVYWDEKNKGYSIFEISYL